MRYVALAWIAMSSCEKHADTPKSTPASDVCPAAQPANAGGCDLQMGKVCTYTLAAVRQVHCHCVGDNWDCGTPLGIDIEAADKSACPAQQPSGACTLKEPAHDGNRPGCFYSADATPIVVDCACARFPAKSSAQWDCGPRGGGIADAIDSEVARRASRPRTRSARRRSGRAATVPTSRRPASARRCRAT